SVIQPAIAGPLITTVAGNGSGTFAGDNGLATAASLQYPAAAVVDGSGNLLIADTYNLRIRRVDAGTGIITTVAGGGAGGDGGPATSASLSEVTTVALDSAGNLLIADRNNNRIR